MAVAETHISSLIVYTKPEFFSAVRSSIERMGICDIAAEDASGKLVLVLETANTHQVTESIEYIQSLNGVINAVMAYHHCEAEDALNEFLPEGMQDEVNAT